MNTDDNQQQKRDSPPALATSAHEKPAWCEPKLTFVEPVLTKEGNVTELTGQGFFGTFIP